MRVRRLRSVSALSLFTALAIGCHGASQRSSVDAGAPRDDAAISGGSGAAAGGGKTGTVEAGRGGAGRSEPSASDLDAGPDPAADGGEIPGDTFLPSAGGASYFAKWSHGPPADPNFFPIAVWLQSPPNASRYKAVGIDLFVGLDDGPTEDQLSALKTAGVPTFCDQSGVWKSHLNDATLWGYLQPDEPDNAQPKPNGADGYDPCIAPSTIVDGYRTMVANDPTRPVWLGLGRGVSDTTWVGRGTCSGDTDSYKAYAKGGDILSFDIYPVNDGIGLEAVPKGVDNLLEWSEHTKPVVADIEASNIDDTTRPSPAQIESEVWMALVHGAAGIQYFCHRFSPTFSETDCLDDAPTAAAMTRIDKQIAELAPVLNERSIANGVTVQSSVADKPIDAMLKRHDGASYLFAVEMRDGATHARFALARFSAKATAEVLGENRSLDVVNGRFEDDFNAYGVHRYKLSE